jgi:hypothetical protein
LHGPREHAMKRTLNNLVLAAAATASAAFVVGCQGAEPSAPSPQAAQEAPMAPAANPPAPDRDVIKTGRLEVRVPDVEAGEKAARRATASLGGYVETSRTTDLVSESPRVDMVVRVPAGAFDQAMAAYAGLGVRVRASESSNDVTTAIVDYDARLKAMVAQEDAILRQIREARSLSDTYALRDRAAALRAEIEAMAGKRKALARQVAMSTIELTLSGDPRALGPAGKDWARDAWVNAGNASGATFQAFGTMGIFFLAFWPLWAVPLALIGLGAWVNRRKRAEA